MRLQRLPVSSLAASPRHIGARITEGVSGASGLHGQTGACSGETKHSIGPQVCPVKCG